MNESSAKAPPSENQNALDAREKMLVNARRKKLMDNMRGNLSATLSAKSVAYDYELMMQFTTNHLGASLSIPLISFIIATSIFMQTDQKQAYIWFAAAMLVHYVYIKFCVKFQKLRQRDVSIVNWQARFNIYALLSGCVWSTLVIFSPFDDPNINAIMFTITLIVYLSIHAMVSAPLQSTVYFATIPVTVLFCINFFFMHATSALIMMAVAIFIQTFFASLSNRLYKASLSSIEAKAEKDLLIGELETARAISDEARRRAEAASDAKSKFLATMSHELRTPLNAIIGFSEILKKEMFGPLHNEKYKDYACDINNSGAHLLKVINEILDLSRIEAGRHDLNEEAIFIARIAEECRQMVKVRAQNKNIEITTGYQNALPAIWGDEKAFRQMILNILTNAIKFTPPHGKVTMKVGWTANGGQYISVSDTGTGIPENEIETVMSNFGRGSFADKSAEEGTGLGLPIVKALIEMHDGAFELKSKVRVGTTAIIRIPEKRVMQNMPKIEEQPNHNPIYQQRA